MVVLQRYREVENLTGNYVFFMGAYRALYILNWIYRANTEKNYRHHWVVYICGLLQIDIRQPSWQNARMETTSGKQTPTWLALL